MSAAPAAVELRATSSSTVRVAVSFPARNPKRRGWCCRSCLLLVLWLLACVVLAAALTLLIIPVPPLSKDPRMVNAKLRALRKLERLALASQRQAAAAKHQAYLAGCEAAIRHPPSPL